MKTLMSTKFRSGRGKIIIATGIFFLVTGLVILTVRIAVFARDNITATLTLSTIIISLFGVIAIVYAYLGGYFPTKKESNFNLSGSTDNVLLEEQDVFQRIASIETDLKLLSNSEYGIDFKPELIAAIKKEAVESFAEDFLENVEDKYSTKTSNHLRIKELTLTFRNTRDRLRIEINELTRRANLNLAVGLSITCGGIAALWYFVATYPGSFKDLNATLSYNLPRLSLVILIEFFSYFFLNLYKSTLNDTKYFQNEITSLECKMLALRTSVWRDKDEMINSVVNSLAKTDRNLDTYPNSKFKKKEMDINHHLLSVVSKLIDKSDSNR